MEEFYERCAGLDVHKNQITATIMIGYGRKTITETRTFETFTEDILAMCEWFLSHGIKDIAMESTGVYSKGPYKVIESLLEKGFNPPVLANARHVRNIPNRKTDVKDSQWLCKIFKHGLITSSFVPPQDIQALRDLTRTRKNFVQERTNTLNRIIKMLESANIKLATVFSTIQGKACMAIIRAIAKGEDFEALISMVPKNVKAKRGTIRKALKGYLTEADGNILKLLLKGLDFLDDQIEQIEELIKEQLKKHASQVELLKTIPGIKDNSAAIVIAEVGTNMAQFHSADHLCSWAGTSPGNNESAGKKKALALILETAT
jgi:transposase